MIANVGRAGLGLDMECDGHELASDDVVSLGVDYWAEVSRSKWRGRIKPELTARSFLERAETDKEPEHESFC